MSQTHQIVRSLEEIEVRLPTLLLARASWRSRNWLCRRRPLMWARPFRWFSELVLIHERESLGENRLILAVRVSPSKNWAKRTVISRQLGDVATSSTATRRPFPQRALGISSSGQLKRRR